MAHGTTKTVLNRRMVSDMCRPWGQGFLHWIFHLRPANTFCPAKAVNKFDGHRKSCKKFVPEVQSSCTASPNQVVETHLVEPVGGAEDARVLPSDAVQQWVEVACWHARRAAVDPITIVHVDL